MTRCESYPPCFETIYFPIAPFYFINKNKYILAVNEIEVILKYNY